MRKMSKRRVRSLRKLAIATFFLVAVVAVIQFIATRDFAVLETAGPIAAQQRQLLIFASILSLFVLVPVFGLTFYIVRTYREDAPRPSTYSPEWDGNRKLEAVWWGVPGIIIVILSVVTWQSSHSLDPFKPIVSEQVPLKIQVVALQWKWLFIYPEQKIASVNYVQIPTDRPVAFQITADAPMNSFWIPQLGGQIYAMSGMSTALHVQADKAGSYQGVSANLSGEGFADMRFTAQAVDADSFTRWTTAVKDRYPSLGYTEYDALAKPSTAKVPSLYTVHDEQLYDFVLAKFASHGSHGSDIGSGNHNDKGESH